MSIMDRIYPVLPSAVQEGLLAIRGMYLKRIRYTKRTWDVFDKLQKTQWYSEQQLKDIQTDQLIKAYVSAFCNSPFYMETYQKLGMNQQQIKHLDALHTLPVIKKEEFRRNSDRIVNRRFDRKRLWAAHTSGTSGKPLTAYYTHEDMQTRFAFFERFYQWYNPVKWRRRASFTGKIVVRTDRYPDRLYRKNPAINQWLFSTHHMQKQLLGKYIDDLIRCGPDQIDGILSPIYILARHLIGAGLECKIAPKVVVTTSETLWRHMRQSVEQAFGCSVANQYSSQEGAPFAYQCPQGGFHMCPESGIFEVLGPDNVPVKPGQLGRLVVTSFMSEATPLIRYDIGDTAILSTEKCSCGRASPCFAAILGRFDDMLFSSQTGLVPRVDSAFKGVPSSIVFSQVAQVGVDTFELRLEVDRDKYRREYGETICHNLTKYLGNRAKIVVTVVDKLPVGAGGKVKAMVNEFQSKDMTEISELWNHYNTSSDYRNM